jgi:hypothetical protein
MSRLGFSVKDPVILERVGPEITVGFLTGPNLPRTQFTIKCVDAGEECDAPARGNSVEGFLPMTKTEMVETVDGLDANTDYTCYVETYYREDGRFSVCKEAKVIPGAVGFKLTYEPFATAADFTEDDRDQVCTNIVNLIGLISPDLAEATKCDILKVKTGSAIVLGETVYEDYQNAALLYGVLEELKDFKGFQKFFSEFMSIDITSDEGDVSAVLSDLVLNAPGPYRYKFEEGDAMMMNMNMNMNANNRRLNRKRLML